MQRGSQANRPLSILKQPRSLVDLCIFVISNNSDACCFWQIPRRLTPFQQPHAINEINLKRSSTRGRQNPAPAAYKWHMRKSVCGFKMPVRAHHLRMLWRIQTCKDLAATTCKLISRSRRAKCHRVRRIRTLLAKVLDCTLKGN